MLSHPLSNTVPNVLLLPSSLGPGLFVRYTKTHTRKQRFVQIGDAIARPADDLFDDDALLEELDMLEEADLEEQLLAPPAVPTARPAAPQGVQQPSVAETKVPVGYDLPSVPTGAPSSTPVGLEEDEDARALRELEASMAL